MMKLSFEWWNYRFLMSLLTIIFIKKETLPQLFSCELFEFSKNTFLTEFLRAAASDF